MTRKHTNLIAGNYTASMKETVTILVSLVHSTRDFRSAREPKPTAPAATREKQQHLFRSHHTWVAPRHVLLAAADTSFREVSDLTF